MPHSNDELEGFRKHLLPLLHKVLEPVGLFAVGRVEQIEYVTSHVRGDKSFESADFAQSEIGDSAANTACSADEELEVIFHNVGIERNALAAYKTHEDGRTSVGSWRMTHHTHPDYVDHGMQVHITLFKSSDDAVDVYAHYEDDHNHSPISHLLMKNYDAKEGVRRLQRLLRNKTSVLS